MTDVKRLESRLTAAIQLAQDLYEDAEPISIWDRFYQLISSLPTQQQLLISGEALKELAHVTLLKSELVQSQYEPSSSDSSEDSESSDDVPEDAGVVIDEEWLQNLVLKTSSLDLSRFAKPDTRLRLPGEEDLLSEVLFSDEELDSAPLDDSPENLEEALAIAHVESVSDWQSKIMSALQAEAIPIDFWILRKKTQLSPSALFLGLLLGSDNWYLSKNEEIKAEDGYGSILVSLIDDVETSATVTV